MPPSFSSLAGTQTRMQELRHTYALYLSLPTHAIGFMGDILFAVVDFSIFFVSAAASGLSKVDATLAGHVVTHPPVEWTRSHIESQNAGHEKLYFFFPLFLRRSGNTYRDGENFGMGSNPTASFLFLSPFPRVTRGMR